LKDNHCSEKKRKGEKGKAKSLISAHARARMSKNAMLVARMASCRVADSFSTRLKLIWQKSSLKNVKMPKKRVFFQNAPGGGWGVNGLKKKETNGLKKSSGDA